MSTTDRTPTGWAARRSALVALCLLGTASPVLAQPSEPPAPCGPTIKAIEISPLKHTDKDLVRRALFSKVGKPYCEGDIHKDLERLDRLGFFSDAKLETVPMDDALALKVNLVETAPYLPNVGISHTEENGLAVGPGLQAINLAHTGIKFSAGSRFGGWTQLYTNFSNPSIPGGHWTYDVLFAYLDRDDTLNDFQRKTLNGTFLLGKTIGETHTLRGVLQVFSNESNKDGITLSDTNRDVIPYLGAEWTKDSRDFWSNPHTGWRNTLDVRRAFGDASFWRLLIDLQRYIPLADRHTLALVSLTDVHTGELGVTFPTYLQSYIGGTNSVRGWDLGARSGQSKMLNTLEYRYQLMKRETWKIWKLGGFIGLDLAAFADFGIAWTDSNQFAAKNFIDGYGGGLRLLLPWVDEIRLDFAAGQPGGRLIFHFGLGPKPTVQRLAAQ